MLVIKRELALQGLAKVMREFSSGEAQRIGGATLSLAVSAKLKDRIDDAAKNEKVSVDAWALRVIEEALVAQQCRSKRLAVTSFAELAT